MRINQNLTSIRSSEVLKNDEMLRIIANDVLNNGGVVHTHPLN